MRAVFQLRFAVPAVLFLLGIVVSVASLLHERNIANTQIEGLISRHIQFIGNQISGIAAYFISHNDDAGLRKQISALGADPILKYAVVCDGQKNILVSSRYEQTGRRLEETPLSHAATALDGLHSARTIFSENRDSLLGVFPFLLPPAAGELISSRTGYLILEYDLAHPKQRILKGLYERWTLGTGFLAVLCVLAWLFFHSFINQRVGRLVETTKRIASGDLAASANLRGSDELAALSRAFDSMARTLSSHTSDLRQANLRMKQEIAERKFIEEALRNSERRFRSIWENSLDAMRLTDAKGTVLAVNPAYCKLIDLPPEDIVERPFIVAHHPERAEEVLKSYQESFANRRVESMQQKRITLHNGRSTDLEVTYSFIEMDRPLLLGIFRDVSDRVATLESLKDAKEFSEHLINTANVMIVGIDREHRLTIFNETAEKISGFSRADILGSRWDELVVSGTQYREEGARRDTSHFAKTFEAMIRGRNGQERLISWQTNSIHEKGNYNGTICFGIDITDKKRQEEQRLALERKLLDSQKLESLGVLAGGIAHDFNNLLTAILGNASLASAQVPVESRIRTYLGNIEKTSMRAAELCKQMLAYSGKGRFSMQYLDVNEVVRETVELLEVSITKKAALRIELRPELPGVAADPTQLRQVLMNLVINASEAIGEQTGLIRIRTGTLTADPTYFNKSCVGVELAAGDYVYVEVSDSGCGMSPETLARIFDPFFTTKFTGRGLGLAAVLGIVRGHNGALKIESQPGRGSTFRFVLPVAQAQAQPLINTTTNGVVEWKGEGTILVVDDDPTVRAVTARMVEACGFEVLQAVDGRHGVQVFSNNREQIRAVVLDLTMPNLNGEEAFEEMRRLKPDVKVLLMSGFSEESREAHLLGMGMQGFLQKPFRPEDLNAKLKSIISHCG